MFSNLSRGEINSSNKTAQSDGGVKRLLGDTLGQDDRRNDPNMSSDMQLAAGGAFLKFRPPLTRGQLPRIPKPNDLPSGKLTAPEVPTSPASSLNNSLSRIGRANLGPTFDRSVKWGDVKSFEDLPAYTRDISSMLSKNNPRSDLPRFLFRLGPLQTKMVDKIRGFDDQLGAAAERTLDLSNLVVDKVYAKGKPTGDRALSQLPHLLESGDVYLSNPRAGGGSRVTIVGPWGSAGDKLLAVIETDKSGQSAEIVSIHPMQRRMFESRLLKTGALGLGGASLLSLDDDDLE